MPKRTDISSILLIVGQVGMPLVCYLSAIRSGFRHLFAIPAVSVAVATVAFLWRVLAP